MRPGGSRSLGLLLLCCALSAAHAQPATTRLILLDSAGRTLVPGRMWITANGSSYYYTDAESRHVDTTYQLKNLTSGFYAVHCEAPGHVVFGGALRIGRVPPERIVLQLAPSPYSPTEASVTATGSPPCHFTDPKAARVEFPGYPGNRAAIRCRLLRISDASTFLTQVAYYEQRYFGTSGLYDWLDRHPLQWTTEQTWTMTPGSITGYTVNVPVHPRSNGWYLVEMTCGAWYHIEPLMIARVELFAERFGDTCVVHAFDPVSKRRLAGARIAVCGRDFVPYDTIVTNADGLARMGLDARTWERDTSILFMTLDGYGHAITSLGIAADYELSSRWNSLVTIWTDRTSYQPGDTVYTMATARRPDSTGRPRVPGDRSSYVAVYSARNHGFSGITDSLSSLGVVHGALMIPPDATYGSRQLGMSAGGGGAERFIQIRRTRDDATGVSVAVEKRRHAPDDSVRVSIIARNQDGTPASNVVVRYSIGAQPLSWANDPTFSFRSLIGRGEGVRGSYRDAIGNDTASTDERGYLTLTFKAAEAGAGDTRIRIAAATRLVPEEISPGYVYTDVTACGLGIDLATDRRFYREKEQGRADIRVSDLDHGRAAARYTVEVALNKLMWTRAGGDSTAVRRIALWAASATTDSAGHLSLPFIVGAHGTLELTARTRDERGAEITRTIILYSIPEAGAPLAIDEVIDRPVLVAERTVYRPGDTALVLAITPDAGSDAHLIEHWWTPERHHLLHMTARWSLLAVPIREEHVPRLSFELCAYAGGVLRTATDSIRIRRRYDALTLSVTTDSLSYQGGGYCSATVHALDAEGVAVAGAELSVWAVSGSPSPIDLTPMKHYSAAFTEAAARIGHASSAEIDYHAFAMDDKLAWYAPRSFSLDSVQHMSQEAYDSQRIRMARRVFRRSKTLIPNVHVSYAGNAFPPDTESRASDAAPRLRTLLFTSTTTDSTGAARIRFRLPTDGGSVQLSVVGVAEDDLLAWSSASVNVHEDVAVRIRSCPQLTIGDSAFIAAEIYNQTPLERRVAAHLGAGGASAVDTVLMLPPHGSALVRLRPDTQAAGTLRVEASASAGAAADHDTISVVVRDRAIRMRRRISTVVSPLGRTRSMPVIVPVARIGTPSMRIVVQPLLARSFVREINRLLPECEKYQNHDELELMHLVAIRAFDSVLRLPLHDTARAGLPARATAIIGRLAAAQKPDGYWTEWGRTAPRPWQYMYTTMYRALALEQARRAGFAVPDSTLERARTWMHAAARECADSAAVLPPDSLMDTKTEAFALYTLAMVSPEPDSFLRERIRTRLHQSHIPGPSLVVLGLAARAQGEGALAEESARMIATYCYAFGEQRSISAREGTAFDGDDLVDWGNEDAERAFAVLLLMETGVEPRIMHRGAIGLMSRYSYNFRNDHFGLSMQMMVLAQYLKAHAGALDHSVEIALNGESVASHSVSGIVDLLRTDTITVKAPPLTAGANTLEVRSRSGPGEYVDALFEYDAPDGDSVPSAARLSIRRTFFSLKREADGRSIRYRAAPLAHLHTGDLVLMRVLVSALDSAYSPVLDLPLPGGFLPTDEDIAGRVRTDSYLDSATVSLYNFSPQWLTGDADPLSGNVRIVYPDEPRPAYRSAYVMVLRAASPGRYAVQPVTFSGKRPTPWGSSGSDELLVEDR